MGGRWSAGLAAIAVLLVLRAEAAPLPVVGTLSVTSAESDTEIHVAFLKGLKDTGQEPGRTFHLERRFADGDNARFPALARDLLKHNPALIISGCGPAQRAVRAVSRNVPLVAICADEKNFLGEVASLRRPGGATTGITFLAPETASKRLEILRELRPGLKRVAFLYHSGDDWDNYWREIERVAPKLGLVLIRLPFRDAGDLDAAFAKALKERAEAMVLFPDATTAGAAGRIAAFALEHRIASSFEFPAFAAAGGLFSYGTDLRDMFQHVIPRFVDRILKGAKPGELPIEQPTKLVLVINMKTARALGLTVPQSVLLRADRVIE
jgi:putative tryptophan/tyrosine transport system substrate-binding protein